MKIIANPELYSEKEELYIKVRDAEKRVLSVDELKKLPYPDIKSPNFAEWQIRAKSFEQLRVYLQKHTCNTPLHILDIGCGNGWMSHRLNECGYNVTAIDLNLTELKQAEAAFGEDDHLQWVYADILKDNIEGRFDIILMSASCQYFQDMEILTNKLVPLLKDRGEIHLHDTYFYKKSEIAEAKERSNQYYTLLGFPEMALYYYHHDVAILKQLGYKQRKPFFPLQKKKGLEWWIKMIT